MLSRLIAVVSICMFFGFSYGDRARGAVLFLSIGPGARASGMGEAFTATADDPTATFWNPAGLGRYPLSSSWHDFPLDEKASIMAIVKTSRADVDFRQYDVWVASNSKLKVLRRDKWWDYEKFSVGEEQISARRALSEFVNIKSYDSLYIIQSLIPELLEFNGLSDTMIPANTDIKIPFSIFIPDSITALCGAKNQLWIGTRTGLYLYRKGVWTKVVDEGAPKTHYISTIAIDERDNVWVGTTDGLFRYNMAGKWDKFDPYNGGLPGRKIQAIFPVGSREVWVVTERGPSKFNGTVWLTSYTFKTPDGATWDEVLDTLFGLKSTSRRDYAREVLLANNGLTPESSVPADIKVDYNLAVESADAIWADESGNIWFGTTQGLVRFDGRRWKFFGWRSEQISQDIELTDWVSQKWSEATEETKKELVSRIYRFNMLNMSKLLGGQIIEFPANPSSGKVKDISPGFGKDDILLITQYGLLRYIPQIRQFRYVIAGELKERNVLDVERAGKEFWFLTDEGVKIYSMGKTSASLMHVKWLPQLADDIYYEYLTGAYYIEDWGTLGGSITYISLGKSDYTTEWGEVRGVFYSYETAVTASYGAKIAPHIYGGINFKFIYSALAPTVLVGHEKKHGVGTSFAIDLGFLWETPLRGLTFGVCAQHLGPNIHYIDAAQADPLPRNLKLGVAWRLIDNDYNRLILGADLNKEIIRFKSPENTWYQEWRYTVKNLGVEYTYANFFSLRGGYIIDYDYYRNKQAASQYDYEFNPADWVATNYLTFGLGIRYSSFAFDFAYIPARKDAQGDILPLSDIMRLSVTAEF